MTIFKIAGRPQRSLKDLEREAIALANQGRWEEAVAVNREALSMARESVEALNRLARALSELGRYSEARESLQRVLLLSPGNTIAKKNLDRIAGLKDTAAPARASSLAPRVFIEDSGKTRVTDIAVEDRDRLLSQLAPGEALTLEPAGHAVVVRIPAGEVVGRITPKLAARLARLMRGGNRYVAAVASVGAGKVSVLIREEYQHPSLSGVVSFPGGAEGPLAYGDELEFAEEETHEVELPRERAGEGDDEDKSVEEEDGEGPAPRTVRGDDGDDEEGEQQ